MSTSPVSESLPDNHAEMNENPLAPSIQKSYRRFNGWLLGCLLGPLLSVGAFNWLVNPYGIYAKPPNAAWNQAKPDIETNDRLHKAARVIHLQPTIVFLGSSRTKQGVDPRHPYFGDRSQTGDIYNLAINGPNLYEVRRYLDHAIANQPNLERVVLGIDFFMFNADLANQSTFLDDRLTKRRLITPDILNTLFSWDGISASIESLRQSRKTLDQSVDPPSWGFEPNRQAIDQSTLTWRFKSGIKLYYRLHRNHQLSPDYMAEFVKIVERCRDAGIQLDVFISPAHASQWEAIRTTGRWDSFEDWKRQIVDITPVWDFSGYHTIASEPISPDLKNYVDNSHYRPQVGALLLNRILEYDTETLPADFGVWLTPTNLEAHLASIREDQQAWIDAYPEEVSLIQELYAEVSEEYRNNANAETE